MSNEIYRKGVVGIRKIDLRPILDERNYGVGWITLGVYPERLIHFAENLQLSMYQFCLFLSEVYERNGGSSTFGDSDLDIYTRHIG